MNCPNCGATVPAGVANCRKCGSAVEQPAQPSQQAAPGPQGPVNVIIQMGPGEPQVQPQMPQQQQVVPMAPKSKILAGVLGILLGFLGVHRFYLGYKGIGLAQLLITLLSCGYGALITVPWGMVEGILILVGTINKDASGQPLKD